jgi:hypothetical protein
MNRTEVAKLLGILRVAYPYFYSKNTSAEDIGLTVELWHDMLMDFSSEQAKLGLMKLISTHMEYPPNIAQVRKAIVETIEPALPTSGEAWSEVQNAILSYGIYRTDEGLNSLSEVTLKAVKTMGWRELCISENQIADRAHFFKIYDVFAKRHDETRLIPSAYREAISQLADDVLSLPDNIINMRQNGFANQEV